MTSPDLLKIKAIAAILEAIDADDEDDAKNAPEDDQGPHGERQAVLSRPSGPGGSTPPGRLPGRPSAPAHEEAPGGVLTTPGAGGKGNVLETLRREHCNTRDPILRRVGVRPGLRRQASTPSPPECPEARPTAVEGYTPGRYEASFWAGFTLGLDREDAAPPAESTPVEARAFQAGWVAGHREWEKRLDEMFAGPEWAEFSDGVTDLDVHPRGVC